MIEEPNALNTFAVILGASEFPHLSNVLPMPALEASAQSFRDYVRSDAGLGLSDSNILWLFDSTSNVNEQDGQITEFVKTAENAKQLLVFYAGHGGFLPNRDYFLALRDTKYQKEYNTGLSAKALAFLLDPFSFSRKLFLILDCCFAGEAVREFQSTGVGKMLEQQTLEALPSAGISLLVAASKDDPAIAPNGTKLTMFSESFIDVLVTGIPNHKLKLSLADVAEESQNRILHKYGLRAVRPEVHSPRQVGTDVAQFPLFPNPRGGQSDFVLKEPSGQSSCPLLRPFDHRAGDAPQGFARFTFDWHLDEFVGREHEVGLLLDSFLRLPSGKPEQFRWHVLLGGAGVGKSRFALELATKATNWPHAGFVDWKAIANTHQDRWQPDCPTFLIIDYAGDEAKYGKDQVKRLLEYLSERTNSLQHPVRVLLMDRLVDRNRIEKFVGKDVDGRWLEAHRFSPEPLILEKLGLTALLSIMRGRIETAGRNAREFSDDLLEKALKAVDPEYTTLFAVLVGDEIGREGRDAKVLLPSEGNPSVRREFLGWLLGREEQRWMHIASVRRTEGEADRQVKAHARLLALLTFTRGLRRELVDPEYGFEPSGHASQLVREVMNGLAFDRALFEQMTDEPLSETDDYLEPLQPDLVGEFMVDEFLKRHPSLRQQFVNRSWILDAPGAAVFAAMVEADYGTAETNPCRYLPSREVWTKEIARFAARALSAITIFYEFNLWDKDPSTAPPWSISRPEKSVTITKLTDAFDKSREGWSRRQLGTGGGPDAGL